MVDPSAGGKEVVAERTTEEKGPSVDRKQQNTGRMHDIQIIDYLSNSLRARIPGRLLCLPNAKQGVAP